MVDDELVGRETEGNALRGLMPGGRLRGEDGGSQQQQWYGDEDFDLSTVPVSFFLFSFSFSSLFVVCCLLFVVCCSEELMYKIFFSFPFLSFFLFLSFSPLSPI